ncbi:hypothetical protein VITFI_CDS1512 [Vitreoscilla filiformis]|uniref:Uncharacterized protein n=1 Tax=Vitreoscilla filiformis TaxID=63 RepID=A0A221KAB7_VITFI|nr:hypothetical protein [Vitreoscilla filiformis]ASM75787.1 hypothetical protein VITFI_CDS0008 [Vitreoscilla filiformis]ASM75911.1 hypothetical protein VITFI_CDS0132 [Vitreoscilla filiformis]ASM76415.1 hypothetical protein VITFI_CDS0636 [Vitreoscilla filiformis]ASM76861.1 hypothetical protein VITFI_CDS1083 [Vitreoscilla filiformis]ASM77290.1 hypothetical protein VITFI_CDS1512 [Vitreoscilla filiformis]
MNTATSLAWAVRSWLYRLEVVWLRHQLATLARREAVYRTHIQTELNYSAALRIELAQMLSETTIQRTRLRARLRRIWRV